MNIKVYTITSAKYHWILPAHAYLFNIYWSELQENIIVTDVIPDMDLPDNFTFATMNDNHPLPKEKWSNGIIRMLHNIKDTHFVLMLEDYLLVRTVDNEAIESLADYMEIHKDIIRCDLTDDRLFAGDMFDADYWGRLDIIETPGDSPYQMSLQAALWNRKHLLDLMRPDLSPWQVELYLSPELHHRNDLRTIGTRQRPLRYINCFKGGDSEKTLNLEGIPNEHLEVMRSRGWIKE